MISAATAAALKVMNVAATATAATAAAAAVAGAIGESIAATDAAMGRGKETAVDRCIIADQFAAITPHHEKKMSASLRLFSTLSLSRAWKQESTLKQKYKSN